MIQSMSDVREVARRFLTGGLALAGKDDSGRSPERGVGGPCPLDVVRVLAAEAYGRPCLRRAADEYDLLMASVGDDDRLRDEAVRQMVRAIDDWCDHGSWLLYDVTCSWDDGMRKLSLSLGL